MMKLSLLFSVWVVILHLDFNLAASGLDGNRDSRSNLHSFPEARVTVYWMESDAYTQSLKSSSGIKLKDKIHAAVDPELISYGSKIWIEGWGEYIAVDTGSAVKKRTAARKLGKDVPVIDIFFMDKKEALQAAETRPSFARVVVEDSPLLTKARNVKKRNALDAQTPLRAPSNFEPFVDRIPLKKLPWTNSTITNYSSAFFPLYISAYENFTPPSVSICEQTVLK
jgi:3D (Asp-Asp-Asp) domain-containing protein